MGAFRVSLLTLVFVVFSTCEAGPVARNTFRSVIDRYIENGTAADIIADALVVALRHTRTPLDNVRYDVGASAPEGVVSVEANDLSSEVPESSLKLKAAAERLADMKAKQKLVSIEILKVDETPRPKKIRKVRRRKLVTKGSLKLSTTQARPLEEVSTEPSLTEASATTAEVLSTTTEVPFTTTEVPFTTRELPATTSAGSEAPSAYTSTPTLTEVQTSSESATTTVPPFVQPQDDTSVTMSTDAPETASSASGELATTTGTPPQSEQAVSDETVAPNSSTSDASNSLQTDFVNKGVEGLSLVSDEATTTASTPVSAVSTEPSVSGGSENIPAQDSSTTVQGLHADKINVENEVLASATHEQPAFTTEMPFTMEVKTLKVISPTGDAHEVKVLSNVRTVTDVDLNRVHVYPKVPLLNEKSQVAVDIGGLRYRQSPRRIKFKVPKGGDISSILPPKGYSLLRAEQTASASHEEFTFVREQTTTPASSSTAASLPETSTDSEIPTSTKPSTEAENHWRVPEAATETSDSGTAAPEATTESQVTVTEPSDTSTVLETTQTSTNSTESTTVSTESVQETTTTERPALPTSTDFTNFVDANTEVSVATSISAVESTTEPVGSTTTAPLPELLLKDIVLPVGQDIQTLLDAASQKAENSTSGARSDDQATPENVRDVEKPEQVTEDWIPRSEESSTVSSERTTTSEPEIIPARVEKVASDDRGLKSSGESFSGPLAPPASQETPTEPAAPAPAPETLTETMPTTAETVTEAQELLTTTVAPSTTEIVTEKPPEIVEPSDTDSSLRDQVDDSGSQTPSEFPDESPQVDTNDRLDLEGVAENSGPVQPQRPHGASVGDSHFPAPPQTEPENTSSVESVPSDVPQDDPGRIPTSQAVTETASDGQTEVSSEVPDAEQQSSDDKSAEDGSLQRVHRQDVPEDRTVPSTESAAVSSDSDRRRVEIQEEPIVPQRFPELHDSEEEISTPESKEVSEEAATPAPPAIDSSAEEVELTTPKTTDSTESVQDVPAEFKSEEVEDPLTSTEEEKTELSRPNLTPTVIPSAPPSESPPNQAERPQTPPPPPPPPHRMVVLDRMNVPVLPFGGSRFAELGFQRTDDGSMRMVINDVMAIIREQDMPNSKEHEEQGSGEITNPPPILSQPKSEPPRAIVTEVPRDGVTNRVIMPDAPTIIMQIPENTPQAKFSLRRIPGHINVPSVYEILDPERRNPARSSPQIESGRAIVTLPLLPLRALPPIQQNYYRYNRIPIGAPQQPQRRPHQFTTPQPFYPQDVYPQQFQTSFPQNYEKLFPQSYQTQQGNLFYVNKRRRSR